MKEGKTHIKITDPTKTRKVKVFLVLIDKFGHNKKEEEKKGFI